MRLCMRCSDFFLDIFDPPAQDFVDADCLNEWLNTFVRSKNNRFITKNEIRQYGPNSLREKNRLNQAIMTLHGYELIRMFQWGKTYYIDVFPKQYTDNLLLFNSLGKPR